MDGILTGYYVNEPTWLYLSTILIVAVFFPFHRFWSVRTLDLFLLLALSPGLLLIASEDDTWQSVGYACLFSLTGAFVVRLACDGLLKHRPRLELNLNPAGMLFLGIATFAFLMTKVVTEPPPNSTVDTVKKAEQLLNMDVEDSPAADTPPAQEQDDNEAQAGPAAPVMFAPAVGTIKTVGVGSAIEGQSPQNFQHFAARIVAVLAHFAVVLGLLFLGQRHFKNWHLGLAMATLYLLLPCTAYEVGKANHVLPAALIVWAFVAYRLPMVAGALFGLACGSLFFPIFLLPLWAAFYGRNGALRFGLALCIVGGILLGSLVLSSADTHAFTQLVIGSIDWSVLEFYGTETAGFWSTYDSNYRIPIAAGFIVVVIVLTVLPRKKNLEHLMAHSAAIIVGTQLWYPRQAGVYLLWYLPLVLMVVFRPRLTNLVPPDTEAEQLSKRQQADPVRPAQAAQAISPRSLLR